MDDYDYFHYRKRNAERFLAGKYAESVAFAACMFVGVGVTELIGTVSISRMINNLWGLNAAFAILFILFTAGRSIFQWEWMWREQERVNDWGKVLMVFSFATGIIQMVMFNLVCVYYLDFDPTAHYTVAGLAVLFSFLHEGGLWAFRVQFDESSQYFLLFLNGFFLVTLFVLALLYAGFSSDNTHNSVSLNDSLFEFGLFWNVSWLICFSIMDA